MPQVCRGVNHSSFRRLVRGSLARRMMCAMVDHRMPVGDRAYGVRGRRCVQFPAEGGWATRCVQIPAEGGWPTWCV